MSKMDSTDTSEIMAGGGEKLCRKAPRNAVGLSIDEKTDMQEIEREHPGRPLVPRRLRRRETHPSTNPATVVPHSNCFGACAICSPMYLLIPDRMIPLSQHMNHFRFANFDRNFEAATEHRKAWGSASSNR
jgi:hypothetical protein